MTNKVALIVAIVLGVLSILGIKFYVDKIKGDVERSQQIVEVLVAARDIRQGETVDAKDLERQKLPRVAIDAMKKTNIENADAIIGAKAQQEIRQGQVLQTYHFAAKRGRSAPLQIGPEWRALTIPVTPVTGVAGLVRPGDYVDVIVSWELKGEGGGGPSTTIHLARTMAKKVLVLATDAHTDPHAEAPLVDYSTVTLRLRSNDANKIVLAVGRQQHVQLSRLEDTAAESPTWDAATPDMIYREVESEIKAGK